MLIVVLTSLFASLSFSKSGFVLAESTENQEENEGEEVEEIFEIREVLSKHTIKETVRNHYEFCFFYFLTNNGSFLLFSDILERPRWSWCEASGWKRNCGL